MLTGNFSLNDRCNSSKPFHLIERMGCTATARIRRKLLDQLVHDGAETKSATGPGPVLVTTTSSTRIGESTPLWTIISITMHRIFFSQKPELIRKSVV